MPILTMLAARMNDPPAPFTESVSSLVHLSVTAVLVTVVAVVLVIAALIAIVRALVAALQALVVVVLALLLVLAMSTSGEDRNEPDRITPPGTSVPAG